MKTQQNTSVESPHNTTDTTNGQARVIRKHFDAVVAQRDELLATCKGALAAISQPVTFTRKRSDREHVRAYKILSADCDSARGWLQLAIRKCEASHLNNSDSNTAQQ